MILRTIQCTTNSKPCNLAHIRALALRSFSHRSSLHTSPLHDENNNDDQVAKKSRNGFWQQHHNQRQFLEQVGRDLGIQNSPDDWYNVRVADVIARGGSNLLRQYGNSLARTLEAVFPEHRWAPHKFVTVPRGYWKDLKNHRQFFDSVAKDLGIEAHEDWYKVKLDDIQEKGGAGLLKFYYRNSLVQALRAVYPEHDWQEVRFAKPSQGYWRDVKNQRKLFDEFMRASALTHLDGWYSIRVGQLRSISGATTVLRYYGNSLIRALRTIYPEHDWVPEKFNGVRSPSSSSEIHPNNDNDESILLSSHRRFFDELAKEHLSITKPEDWYLVRLEDVSSRGGKQILRYYGGSLERALKSVYPGFKWDRSRFGAGNRRNWADENNRRQFLDSVGRELGIKNLDDWYKVKLEDIYSRGGRGLLNTYYSGSLYRALQSLYPDHDWQPTKFGTVSRGYWKDINNQRKFFEQVAKELGLKTLDDWYNVTYEELCAKKGGSAILSHYYGNSLARALQALYPEHDWKMPNFSNVSRGYWRDVRNQRQLFDDIAKDLGLTNLPEDWYSVKIEDVFARGGRSVINQYYNGSLAHAIQSIYPEHSWQSWRFPRIAYGSTDGDALLSDYINALAKEFSIESLDDWYRVSKMQIRNFGGYGIISRNGGLYVVLKKLYPNHNWDIERFSTSVKKSAQRRLVLAITKLFPDAEVLEDFLHPDLTFSASKQSMELDVYVPSLGIAFEYQGEQHYQDLMVFGSQANYKVHDDEKIRTCQQLGITFIPVPYWWDHNLASLAATIRAARPDLSSKQLDLYAASGSGDPIPSAPPSSIMPNAC